MSCVRLNHPESKEMEDGNEILKKTKKRARCYLWTPFYISIMGEETVVNVGIIMQTHCVYFFSLNTHTHSLISV